MSVKTYCKKTAAFAGWLIQNVPLDLDEETMNNWMGDPEGTKKFLSGLKSKKMTLPLFSVVATTNLGAIAGKPTKRCFAGSHWRYRDSDFDSWLPANQPNADECVIATLAPANDWTFAEVAATILGIGAGTDVALLGKALIENGHTMTLAQAEEMVEKTERGEKTGMRTDGYGHFFFVETGDRKNPVSVGFVRRDGRGWDARVLSLGFGFRWCAGDRLLVRNLKDTSKLGL